MRAEDVSQMTVRAHQRSEIEAWLATVKFSGRVLDYGCGDQPYRWIVVQQGAEYVPFNRARYPGTPHRVDVGPPFPLRLEWDVVLCTQMLQYVPEPLNLLADFHRVLRRRSGLLVLTYQTNWQELELEDWWRFTAAGIQQELVSLGFTVLEHRVLGTIEFRDFVMPLGHGVVASA